VGEKTESWDYIVAAADRLVAALREESRDVDTIVGVARGGWIPARLVAGRLGVKRLYSFGITYVDPQRSSLVVYQRPDLKNAKILLIEDAVESGKALQHSRDDLSAENRVTTAAFIATTSRLYTPDIWLDERESVPTMPWE
jgi:hypothetical protein